jgi:UPF0042 nucleotide-binding protein
MIKLMSFGFKYGGPPNANYYFDVGFVKNPARKYGFWSDVDEEMTRFVLEQQETCDFIETVIPLIVLLSKVDQRQIFAFGCSAGRHRSSIIVNEIARRLKDMEIPVDVEHRDLG